MGSEPLGKDSSGGDVFFADVWPTNDEINRVVSETLNADAFRKRFKNVFDGNKRWNAIDAIGGDVYETSSRLEYMSGRMSREHNAMY